MCVLFSDAIVNAFSEGGNLKKWIDVAMDRCKMLS